MLRRGVAVSDVVLGQVLELWVVVHVLQGELWLREVVLWVHVWIQVLLQVLHWSELVELLHEAELWVLAKIYLVAPHDIIDARTDVACAHEDLVLALWVQFASFVHLVDVVLGKATALALDTSTKRDAVDTGSGNTAEAVDSEPRQVSVKVLSRKILFAGDVSFVDSQVRLQNLRATMALNSLIGPV